MKSGKDENNDLIIFSFGRRQKAEGRRQKAEGRRQKAEGRRQVILGKKGLAIYINLWPIVFLPAWAL